MDDSTNEKGESETTPQERFLALAKRIVAAPKKEVDAMQAEWKKTKHKRGPTPLPSPREGA